MRATCNTEPIELSRPLPRGIGNIALRINTPSIEGGRDTLTVSTHVTDHYRSQEAWKPLTADRLPVMDAAKSTVTDLLASISFFSDSATSIAAAALFNWLSLFGRGNSTTAVSVPLILYAEQLLRRPIIAISPLLRMSRSNFVATALTPPSATLLTWAEVLADERNE